MSLDADDEILQDFLVEASEIVEQLGEQLVDLEQRPEDSDLLNAIFRGFHTVKGGAGFLAITPLVDTCHRAEDVFNVLRQGQRQVSPALMDTILKALDAVNEMMDRVRDGELPEPAEPALLDSLEALALPHAGSAPAVETALPEPESKLELATAVADAASEPRAASRMPGAASAPAAEDITEQEFEALLDELHGSGRFSGTPRGSVDGLQQTSTDEISEDEFEALLDELHGKGRFGGSPGKSAGPAVADPSQSPGRMVAGQSPQLVPVARPEPVAQSTKAEAAARIAENPRSVAKATQAETTVRVDTQRLDDIMNMVGELVLVRNRLATLKSTLADEELANAVGNLDVVTADLQLSVMKTRMQPVKKVFGRFPRVVRDLARNLNKEVELVLHGEETDLDKNLVEALADPLVHLVRNAVDHGIEPPDAREQVGKARRGMVVLSAAQEGDHILLSIEDDGRGMDAEVLRRKAVEKGMMDEDAAARLDDKDCYNLIFAPGFSTKTAISDVSGRGVGMDVVKTRIAQMNGTVEIDSILGRGSKITVKLPLTLAILPTLMVILGQQPFALPLASVVEILNLDLSRTNTVDGQLTIRVRGRALPLFFLRNWLVSRSASVGSSESTQQGHVVVVNVGGVQVGLVVDFLVGQEEVVIKPLGALLQGLDGMAGATITGDGKIALILDIPGLMRKYARRF
jgi:two-component system chemotaxis sensor kinase CheA